MLLLVIVSALVGCSKGFDLTILHNNDIHAHFEQIDKYAGECSKEEADKNECYGGEARRVTLIKRYRSQIPNNLLVLDAGDRFTGTLWFIQYKGAAASTFVNMEGFDAYCLGNHEFDLGIEGLVPYLDNLTVPVLDSNIDVSREPRMQGKFNKSLVLERGGHRIGIVGYITPDTGFISNAGPTLTFTDPLEPVKAEVKRLKDSGVKIIIGLSHAGYVPDQEIARQVDGLDIIVGGHSHTFLYTGTPPSTEEVEGPYPTLVTQASGRKVLVVQAYAWGKYMGLLNVTFDDDMEVDSWSGNPVLLDSSIPQDASTLQVIDEMKKPLEKIREKIVGETLVRLEGEGAICRRRECNAGNLITDAMVMHHAPKKTENDTWALASIAIMNSGGIRTTTEPGNITNGQILTVMPFGNTVAMADLEGRYLREALEHSVLRYDPGNSPGAFLQVSGLRVKYDLGLEPNHRVVSVETRCRKCLVPTYSPLNDSEVYRILLPNFVLDGGDGFETIKNHSKNPVELGSVDVDVMRAYLATHNPVYAEVEGRIQFVNTTGATTTTPPPRPAGQSTADPCTTSSAVTTQSSGFFLTVVFAVILILKTYTY